MTSGAIDPQGRASLDQPSEMEYRRVGKSGLRLSAISLGTWATIGEALDLDGSVALLETAYDLGINFFDGAETYGHGHAEEVLGQAVERLRWPRETFVLSSKVYWGTGKKRPNTWGLSRKHVVEACHAALRRLRVDYLDVYLCHRPDPATPIEETVRAMSDLITQGKVLYWGTSEWTPVQVLNAYYIARQCSLVPPTLEQLQYNMFIRRKVEIDFPPVCDSIGLGVTTWSPLAYGLLSGRCSNGLPPGSRLTRPGYEWLRAYILGDREKERLDQVRHLDDIASSLGVTLNVLALAWVLRNPYVASAVTGASNPTQLRDNVASIRVVASLDSEVIDRIETVLFNNPARAPE